MSAKSCENHWPGAFLCGNEEVLRSGVQDVLTREDCRALSQFLLSKKEKGVRFIPLPVSPSYVRGGTGTAHLSRSGVPSSLCHLRLGWIIGRHHKATGTLRGDCYMFYTGYCGNALGESEPIRILNQPNELIPISTARPNKTVYSTAGLASTETLLMIERQEFCNGLG